MAENIRYLFVPLTVNDIGNMQDIGKYNHRITAVVEIQASARKPLLRKE